MAFTSTYDLAPHRFFSYHLREKSLHQESQLILLDSKLRSAVAHIMRFPLERGQLQILRKTSIKFRILDESLNTDKIIKTADACSEKNDCDQKMLSMEKEWDSESQKIKNRIIKFLQSKFDTKKKPSHDDTYFRYLMNLVDENPLSWNSLDSRSKRGIILEFFKSEYYKEIRSTEAKETLNYDFIDRLNDALDYPANIICLSTKTTEKCKRVVISYFQPNSLEKFKEILSYFSTLTFDPELFFFLLGADAPNTPLENSPNPILLADGANRDFYLSMISKVLEGKPNLITYLTEIRTTSDRTIFSIESALPMLATAMSQCDEEQVSFALIQKELNLFDKGIFKLFLNLIKSAIIQDRELVYTLLLRKNSKNSTLYSEILKWDDPECLDVLKTYVINNPSEIKYLVKLFSNEYLKTLNICLNCEHLNEEFIIEIKQNLYDFFFSNSIKPTSLENVLEILKLSINKNIILPHESVFDKARGLLDITQKLNDLDGILQLMNICNPLEIEVKIGMLTKIISSINSDKRSASDFHQKCIKYIESKQSKIWHYLIMLIVEITWHDLDAKAWEKYKAAYKKIKFDIPVNLKNHILKTLDHQHPFRELIS